MPKTRLQETLEELEQELEATHAVDARSRELLEHVLGEVRELIGRTEEPEDKDRSIRERLAEATRDFETEHPALAEVVGRLAAVLSNLGI